MQGAKLQGRGLRQPDHPHHRPRLPVVLLQPGPGLPPQGPRDPDEGAHGAGHRHRQPAAAGARRAHPGRSSTPATTRRAASCSSPPRRAQVKKTRFTEYDKSPARGLHRHQPQGRRRAGPGHPDQRRATTSSWSAATARPSASPRTTCGPRAGRPQGVIGMRLQGRRRGRVAATSPATTSTILIVTDAGYGKRTKLDKLPPQGPRRPWASAASSSRPGGATWWPRSWSASTTRSSSSRRAASPSASPVRDISSQGRDATGVRVMNLDAGQTVAAVAPVLNVDDSLGGLAVPAARAPQNDQTALHFPPPESNAP